MNPVLGDWVRTQHGDTGRVTAIHDRCPEKSWWIDMQSIPVTEEQLKERWVSVLCHEGGSVTQPISTVVILEEHPEVLDNSWADVYFRQEVSV